MQRNWIGKSLVQTLFLIMTKTALVKQVNKKVYRHALTLSTGATYVAVAEHPLATLAAEKSRVTRLYCRM